MALLAIVPDRLWIAAMPARFLGFEVGARMTVVRLADGALWVHSPISLTKALKHQIDALGPVGQIVSPSRFHYLHVAEFGRAYPGATISAAPGAAKRLKALSSVRVLGDRPEPSWDGVLEQSLFRGSRLYDEVDFFHLETRTLILTDLCFNIPENSSGMTRFAARAAGILGRLSNSRSFPLTIRDRPAVIESLERILAWDFDRVIVSHGEIVEEGKAAFRKAFGWLLGAE